MTAEYTIHWDEIQVITHDANAAERASRHGAIVTAKTTPTIGQQ